MNIHDYIATYKHWCPNMNNSLSREIVSDIGNLSFVSSFWNSRNVKDYDKNSSDPR